MSATLTSPGLAEWTKTRSDRPARWPLCALVIGATGTDEFAPVIAVLRDRTDAVFVTDLPSAIDAVSAEDRAPDLVVLLEERPGELSRAEFDQLRAAAPLARVVSVLGSWCEGEYRSGHPWPAAVRVYWHQFPGWFRHELSAIERGECSALCLPITATEEERLLQSRATTMLEPTDRSTQQCVAIYSIRREMRDLLADICQTASLRILPLPVGEGRGEGSPDIDPPSVPLQPKITIAIWDLATVESPEIAAFAAAAATAPHARWIVLAGFLREETHAELLRCGASEMVSKPLVVDHLRAALLARSSVPKDGQRLLFC